MWVNKFYHKKKQKKTKKKTIARSNIVVASFHPRLLKDLTFTEAVNTTTLWSVLKGLITFKHLIVSIGGVFLLALLLVFYMSLKIDQQDLNN